MEAARGLKALEADAAPGPAVLVNSTRLVTLEGRGALPLLSLFQESV